MFTTALTAVGNLAADPELRFTTSGKPVLEFRIMSNRRTQDSAGNWTDAPATPVNCKLWGSAAENAAESLTKGSRVLVHGHIETETWTDNDTGDNRSRDILNVDELGPSLKYHIATPTKPTKQQPASD